VQKPDTLTTAGRFNSNDYSNLNNRYLIPESNDQFTPAINGQATLLVQPIKQSQNILIKIIE
jgi:hypothetical protein